MGTDEAELIARLRAGDRMALETLYRQHVQRVWRYGWFITRSRDAAAEIVQETFLRVLRSVGRFEARSTLATWLLTVTRSAALEYVRRRQRERLGRSVMPQLHVVSDSHPAVTAGGDPPGNAAMSDADATREEVRAALATLPEAQRDVLILHELCELSVRDAAGVLGWSETRTKVTLFRARRRLRETLSAAGVFRDAREAARKARGQARA
ncbi:MAG TPA: RNA polymerase sigma factor [Phycisphaerae bacterium]|nr:RNA polymerase sigma factor [Phycisphaerae bacterium]HNU46358.1 RNA polymerase sigma factor [Phycisphaerae bacterium]